MSFRRQVHILPETKSSFKRLLRIFQRQARSFAKTIFSFACYLLQVFNQAYYITDVVKLIVFRCYVNVNMHCWR
jgi:hypothetical protein